MRIGIDIDGVLYPWTDAANAALVERFGIEDPGPHLGWDWLKEQITGEQWRWLWTPEGQEASFDRIHSTFPDVVEAFGAILASGHECHFVTHRDPVLTSGWTADFLAHHFRGYRWAGLHVLGNSYPKHSLMEWDVFIDDKPETVKDFLLYTRAQVFSPVRPWNGELEGAHWNATSWLTHYTYPGVNWHATPRLTRYTDPRQVAEWVLAQ